MIDDAKRGYVTVTAKTDLVDVFMAAVPERFMTLDPERIRRIHDFYDFAVFLPIRWDTYSKARKTKMQREAFYKERLIGYRGWTFEAYWWFVAWRAISLGVSIHTHNPANIEFHLPFGFVRIGFTGQPERETQYEEWLCDYILKAFDSQEDRDAYPTH